MPPTKPSPPSIGTAHHRRLRAVWRSAGWPFQDLLEVELLAAGLLSRERDAQGRESVRVTDAGVAVLAQTLQNNRGARSEHEALVARVAREMQRAGRVVWRGLSLRARVGEAPAHPVVAGPAGLARRLAEPATGGATGGASGGATGGLIDAAIEGIHGGAHDGAPTGPTHPALAAGVEPGWAIAMPDVYSIRHTTVEDYVEPVAHEIKVRRADLLADLRRPAKGEAYRWLSGECWYVIRDGIAQPQEIPEVYGVLLARPDGALDVARPAPRRGLRLPFAVWMALARATPERGDDDEAQPALGDGLSGGLSG
jgi:hypothetical protein